MVELVKVALLPFKLLVVRVFPEIVCPVKLVTVVEARVEEAVTERLPVVVKPEVLEVVALVVEALLVMKFELLPKRVEMYALRAFKKLENNVPPTFKLVIEEVAATN